MLKPAPKEWTEGVTARGSSISTNSPEMGAIGEGPESDCLPCESWDEVILAWKKAVKWTTGLDLGLSVILACVTSTRQVGDQLWCKVIGPPSCLHGDTLIYDPIDGSTLTVRERWKLGVSFSVYSKEANGKMGVRMALPPQKFDPAPMYAIKTCYADVTEGDSAHSLKVTGGHRIWNGQKYVSVDQLREIRGSLQSAYLLVYEPLTGDLFSPRKLVVTSVESIGYEPYYDFHVPVTNNYWAEGLFHHNSGKTILAEAVSVNKRFVSAKSTIRGFHSGYQSDREGSEDNSLLAKLKDKTLVTKDGDTLLQAPNLGQILAEARDIYDRVSRTHYRNKMSADYEGYSLTWVLLGTESLRMLDASELGERFVDVVVVDEMEEELEHSIAMRKARQTAREIHLVSDGKMETRDGPEMVLAKQLTGGYVGYLRRNASQLLSEVSETDEALERCVSLAEFVSFVRARPSKRQDEKAQRELCFRLTSQMVRLAKCLAVVLNKTSLDGEVLRRVTQVALDTARGRTYKIIEYLYSRGLTGAETSSVSHATNEGEGKERELLVFLRRIKVVEWYKPEIRPGVSSNRSKWRLTSRMSRLYQQVTGEPPWE